MRPSDKKITLKLKGGKKYTTSVGDIVCIESIQYNSNNKIIYFKNHKAEVLVNFTSCKDITGKLHLTDGELMEVGRGVWVNSEQVEKWLAEHQHLHWVSGTFMEVKVRNEKGEVEHNHKCFISRAVFNIIKKLRQCA